MCASTPLLSFAFVAQVAHDVRLKSTMGSTQAKSVYIPILVVNVLQPKRVIVICIKLIRRQLFLVVLVAQLLPLVFCRLCRFDRFCP